MSTRLSVSNVDYAYQQHSALSNVNFSLSEGQYSALLGANGAGKTTLFSLLAQFLKPKRGEICFYQNNLPVSPRVALRLTGFVFQQTALDLDLSVKQNLLYHAALHGIGRKEAEQRIDLELERLRFGNQIDQKVRSLNGGHRRRVEIARALLHRPTTLILDEPTAGLDVQTRAQLNSCLRELCREQGTSILCTTHLPDDVELNDQLLILRNGQIFDQGRCSKLLNKYGASDLPTLLLRQLGD